MDKNLAIIIDHTLLKPESSAREIVKLCQEAKEYGFFSVCINPCHIELAKKELENSNVKICTVIGFPLGAMTTESKIFETKDAISKGADEIDMVINVGMLKDNNDEFVLNDIKSVVEASEGKTVKVILETCLLTKEEKIRACELSKKAGASFVKTSTGFNKGGATKEDISLMRKTVGEEMGVKASGAVRDYETAILMKESGASRIGASASIAIVTKDNTSKSDY